jgi:hypothetical protein
MATYGSPNSSSNPGAPAQPSQLSRPVAASYRLMGL